jgi:hypothetical protein
MRVKAQCARAVVLVGFILTAGCAWTQTAPPTGQQVPATAQRPVVAAQASAPPKGTAIVELHDGLLHISASDVDLNSVLQQVARVTGMRLQGSTLANHIFGEYGPGAPGEVLSRLLDGVPCNFVMTQEPGTAAPQELVISARNSGDMSAPPEAMPVNRTASRRWVPPAARQAQPEPAGQAEQPEQQAEPAEEAPVEQPQPEPEVQNPPQAAEQPQDNSGRPNEIKTPEQFMDELNKARQQQEQNSPQ